MRRHPLVAVAILDGVELSPTVLSMVRSHHENLDGTGYPDHLVGRELSLPARIARVADAFDAMTSDRPYRDAMPSRVARMRLAQGVESQFDTTIVAAFEAILAGADEEYRTGRRADFSLADQDIYSEPEPEPEPDLDLEPEQQPQSAKQPVADVA
jgi:HD-GYP domain-containing protein (c-di-GMP phosphodiesterase class II)